MEPIFSFVKRGAPDPLIGWNRPVRTIASFTRDACEEKGSGRAAGELLEKKLRCDIRRDVAAELTARFEVRRLSRVGTTGRFPVIMRALRISEAATPCGKAEPRPKLPAGTPETPWRSRSFAAISRRFEMPPRA